MVCNRALPHSVCHSEQSEESALRRCNDTVTREPGTRFAASPGSICGHPRKSAATASVFLRLTSPSNSSFPVQIFIAFPSFLPFSGSSDFLCGPRIENLTFDFAFLRTTCIKFLGFSRKFSSLVLHYSFAFLRVLRFSSVSSVVEFGFDLLFSVSPRLCGAIGFLVVARLRCVLCGEIRVFDY